MSNLPMPLPPVPPAPIAGPLLLGYLFNLSLYGILSVQVYLYYLSFPKDSRAAKILVGVVYLIETTQTFIILHDSFAAFATNFGNLVFLNSMQQEWLAVPVFSGIVSAMVQMYYAYRVSILSGSRLLGLGISFIAVLQGSSAIATGAQAFIIGNFTGLATKAFVSCAIWLAGSATCDVIIAACMTHLLLKRNTNIPATQMLVTRLVRLIVETGMLTALAATTDLTLFLAFRHSAYHSCVALTLAKLYSNSLLVLFNNRIRIIGGRNDTASTSDSHNNIMPKGRASSEPTIANTARGGAIRWLHNSRTAATTLNGVHVHEERWINTEPESIELQDQSELSLKKPATFGPEV